MVNDITCLISTSQLISNCCKSFLIVTIVIFGIIKKITTIFWSEYALT